MTCLGRRNTHRHSGHSSAGHQGSWTSAINTIILIIIIFICVVIIIICIMVSGSAGKYLCLYNRAISEIYFPVTLSFLFHNLEQYSFQSKVKNPACWKSRRTWVEKWRMVEIRFVVGFSAILPALDNFWIAAPWWINCEPEVCGGHYWG